MTARILKALPVCFAMLVGNVAWAQNTVDVNAELERASSTTPEQKAAFAASSVSEITEALATVTELLEKSKDSEDSQAVQCITARHAAIKALHAVSTQAERDMLSAIQSREAEKADHEFRKIAVALHRARMLLAEAERCTGGEQLSDGTTSVQLNVSDDMVAFEDDWLDIDDTDVGFDPPEVSPFQ